MAGNFAWTGSPTAIPSPPTTVTNGSLGKWGLQDITALSNVSHLGYQVSFTLSADELGSADFYIADSINGTLVAGGQNEPATLTRIQPVQLNGFASTYVTPLMIINRPTSGIWPPHVQLVVAVATAGASISIVNSLFRVANWVS
jgi:hypothetical protein